MALSSLDLLDGLAFPVKRDLLRDHDGIRVGILVLTWSRAGRGAKLPKRVVAPAIDPFLVPGKRKGLASTDTNYFGWQVLYKIGREVRYLRLDLAPKLTMCVHAP